MSHAVEPLSDLLAQYEARLAALESQLGVSPPAAPAGGAAAAGGGADPASIVAYDGFVAERVTPFKTLSDKIGGKVAALGDLVCRAFAEQRAFLLMASQSKKPSNVAPLLAGVQGCLREAGEMISREDTVNHEKAVNEGLQCLSWLAGNTTPKGFIEEFVGGAEFWSNKIRMQYKGTNQDQCDWAGALSQIIRGLAEYVKDHQTCGVVWNPRGADASPPAAAAAPAPAPAPAAAAESKSSGGGVGLEDVFAGIRSIDQSSGRTAGLNQVKKEDQTWRAEYKGGAKPTPAAKPRVAPRVQETPTGTPKCELVRGKWEVEHQGEGVVNVDGCTMRQQVYIYKCIGATIVITGKPKSITMDSCKRVQVVFEDALTAAEIVNCQRVKVQCSGMCPSIAIDKTDGCTWYLSRECAANALIVCSKISECNVNVPLGTDDADLTEIAIPEQYQHRLVNGQLTADVSDLYSH